MGSAYKLHVKIGQSEFTAEGTEESVKQDYERFLAALSIVPSPARPLTENLQIQPGRSEITTPDLEPTVLQRAFTEDQQGIVSLRVRPSTPNRVADALLLILYGFRFLRSQHDVPVIQLMEAARQSGVGIDRIDRAIAPHRELITYGGTRRGGRYGLNNPGVIMAETLLREMFEAHQ